MSEQIQNKSERYNRQELIPGWDQEKLDKGRIAIIGSDWLAAYTALTATALGIGNITIIDNKSKINNFLNYSLDRSMLDSKELAIILSKINPFVNVKSLETSLINEGSKYFLENQDIIIELTNDPRSKAISLEYSHEKKIPCITGSTMNYYGKIMKFNNDLDNIHYFMTNFQGHEQDPIMSIPLAGIIVEETKKILMGEEPLEKTIYYTPTRAERFKPLNTKDTTGYRLNSNYTKAIIIGAGALGNVIALALQHMNLKEVYVIDPDKVEETNLNRQILYYDSVGEYKAEVLAKKIGTKTKAIVEEFPLKKNILKKNRLPTEKTIMFDCVDNFKTRFEINKYAVENGIPLISGGTDYQAGQVAVYVPGKTSCIEHQLNLKESAEKAEEAARQSCIYSPNPSVITSNMIIGGLMPTEAKIIIDDKEPLHGMLKYGSNLENRLGFTPVNGICDCNKKYLEKKK